MFAERGSRSVYGRGRTGKVNINKRDHKMLGAATRRCCSNRRKRVRGERRERVALPPSRREWMGDSEGQQQQQRQLPNALASPKHPPRGIQYNSSSSSSRPSDGELVAAWLAGRRRRRQRRDAWQRGILGSGGEKALKMADLTISQQDAPG